MEQARDLATAMDVQLTPGMKMDIYKREVLMPAMHKAADEDDRKLQALALKVHTDLHRNLTNTRYNQRRDEIYDRP